MRKKGLSMIRVDFLTVAGNETQTYLSGTVMLVTCKFISLQLQRPFSHERISLEQEMVFAYKHIKI